MTKLGEGNGGEYEEVVRSPEAPVSGGGVEVMYEMPSAPPSHQPLPAIYHSLRPHPLEGMWVWPGRKMMMCMILSLETIDDNIVYRN